MAGSVLTNASRPWRSMEAKTAYAKSKRSRRRSRGAESGARRLAAALPLRRTAARPTRRMIASRRGTVLRRGAQRSPPRLRIAIAPPGASGAVQDGRRGAIPTFGSDRPRIAPPGAAQTDAPRPTCRFPADAPRPICRFPADGTPLHLSRSGRCSLRHLPGSDRCSLRHLPGSGRCPPPHLLRSGRCPPPHLLRSDRCPPRHLPGSDRCPPRHLPGSDRCPPPHRSPSGKRLPGHLPGSDRCPPPHRSFSGGRCCTAYNRRPRARCLRAGVSCGNLSQKETTHAPAARSMRWGLTT